MSLIDLKGLEPFADILKEIYGDMAKPGVQQVGVALSAILGLGVTLLWPIMWANERARITLEDNLEAYRKRLQDVPPEQIIPAAPEVAMPIVEKLGYVTNEELRNLYIELLAKASIHDLNGKAHPSFVNIINNLSPDEAILLEAFNHSHKTPPLRERAIHYIRSAIHNDKIWIPVPDYFFELGDYKNLVFKENVPAYLSNLVGLGVLTLADSSLINRDLYEKLCAKAKEDIRSRENFQHYKDFDFYFTDGVIKITSYGELFLEALFLK